VSFPPGTTEAAARFPFAITPYYLSLIRRPDDSDPIFSMAVPQPAELIDPPFLLDDPLEEDEDMPVPGLVHRYPDRALVLVTTVCAMYCRHCTRKRRVGDRDSIPGRAEIEGAIDYIRDTPEIRDVLLSGGDPLMLGDEYLDWILTRLRKIPHVEIIRIGSRLPVVLPYRVTDELVGVLKKHHPVYLNTHFNHPRELTESSRTALARLADAGIPLGNQTVLLCRADGLDDSTILHRPLPAFDLPLIEIQFREVIA